MRNKRKPRAAPAEHAKRLLAILTANLAQATEPALRARLERAIAALKERTRARAA
jgi:hypothetical protein